MEGNKVLITGATSGIGFAICAAARSAGMHVVAIQRIDASGEKLRALLMQDPLSCVLTADLSHDPEIENLCKELQAKDISLSWIIHAAGMIDESEKTSALSHARTAECFQINTIAPIRISQTLEPLITKNGGIIFISSTAGIWGNSGFPVYSSTKAALHNFGLSLAKKWTGTDRKSIVVTPGGTNTRMREKTADDAATSQSPDFVAGVALDIMTSKFDTTNGDVVLVKNSVVSKIPIAPAI